MEIHSFRSVFHLERRIYRIDRIRLNPAGVPVRGVVYFLVLLAAASAIAALPGVGLLAGQVPWYVRQAAFPAGAAALLGVLNIDGRPAHVAARAIIRYACSPRETAGGHRPLRRAGPWRPPELTVLPDGGEGATRRLHYIGPGAVRVSAAHRRIEWRDGQLQRLLRRPQLTLLVDQARLPLARAQLIELPRGARLEVR